VQEQAGQANKRVDSDDRCWLPCRASKTWSAATGEAIGAQRNRWWMTTIKRRRA
jgi:hypothetical protein